MSETSERLKLVHGRARTLQITYEKVVLTLNLYFRFCLVGVSRTFVHAAVGDLRIFDDHLPLTAILSDGNPTRSPQGKRTQQKLTHAYMTTQNGIRKNETSH